MILIDSAVELAIEVAVILNDPAEEAVELAIEVAGAGAGAIEEGEALETVEAVEAVGEVKEEEALEEEEAVGAVEAVELGPQVKMMQECLRHYLIGIRQGEQESKWQSQRLGTPRLVMAVP